MQARAGGADAGADADDAPVDKEGRHQCEAASLLELPREDARNMALLVLLYFLQGVPFGLISGSIPFLFKPHLSYSEVR